MANTVLITGASRGIGAATARYFGEQGWQVAVHYHEREDLALEQMCIRDRPHPSAQFDKAGLPLFGAVHPDKSERGVWHEDRPTAHRRPEHAKRQRLARCV